MALLNEDGTLYSVGTFDRYVDSVSGNDANAGTSEASDIDTFDDAAWERIRSIGYCRPMTPVDSPCR